MGRVSKPNPSIQADLGLRMYAHGRFAGAVATPPARVVTAGSILTFTVRALLGILTALSVTAISVPLLFLSSEWGNFSRSPEDSALKTLEALGNVQEVFESLSNGATSIEPTPQLILWCVGVPLFIAYLFWSYARRHPHYLELMAQPWSFLWTEVRPGRISFELDDRSLRLGSEAIELSQVEPASTTVTYARAVRPHLYEGEHAKWGPRYRFTYEEVCLTVGLRDGSKREVKCRTEDVQLAAMRWLRNAIVDRAERFGTPEAPPTP